MFGVPRLRGSGNVRHGRLKAELQAAIATRLSFETWSFSGAWMLEFGASSGFAVSCLLIARTEASSCDLKFEYRDTKKQNRWDNTCRII